MSRSRKACSGVPFAASRPRPSRASCGGLVPVSLPSSPRRFTMRSALVLAIGALSASVIAQTNILPTSANGVAGSTGNLFPWGTAATAYPGLRIMCVYDSTHFTNAPIPITTPILITSVKWRADDVASSWSGGTYSNATLSLATAAVDHAATSTSWAANVGPDYTQVHNGPVTVLPGTGAGAGVPGPWV